MATNNTKKNNKAELNKLQKNQAHVKQVKQAKTGKITKPKSLKKKPESAKSLSRPTSETPDANVTIQKRTVKIKPAA